MPKERIPSPGGMNLLARLISRIKSGLGIVEETNTATHTIAAGKYVTWKGNVYRAKSAIPSGTTLSSSNLETLSDGGLNDLSGLLNGKIILHSITDCNDAPMGDSYISAGENANTPTTSGYYFVHTFNESTAQHNAQIAIKRNSTYVDTYVRNKNAGTWGSWYQVQIIR